MQMTHKMRSWVVKRHGPDFTGAPDMTILRMIGLDLSNGDLTQKGLDELAGEEVPGPNPSERKDMTEANKTSVTLADLAKAGINVRAANPPGRKATPRTGPTPQQVMARTNKGGTTLSTKRATVLTKAGTPFMPYGKAVEAPSQQDYAVIGAFLKHKLFRRHLTPAEEAVLLDSFDRDEWYGEKDDEAGVRFKGDDLKHYFRTKALLDDSVSGGIEVVPMILDEAIVTYPLLNGQLAPYVDTVEVNGRRIVTPNIQNPTMQWGTAEGSAIQPFNTSQIIASLGSPVFPLVGAIEMGRDWLEDTPIQNMGKILTDIYSERTQAELDKVIALGDGVTQPQGIFNATGTVTVNSDYGAGGPPTVSDVERLMFGVPKQYREMPSAQLAYVMNDTTYQRIRSVPVGQGDERRVFGMDHQAYTLFNNPVRINNGLANGKLSFQPLKKYRLFRRKGLDIRTVTDGRALALANTVLYVVRARFGGQVIDPNAVAIMPDMQS
jgi:HK97 family phage major capsid protein